MTQFGLTQRIQALTRTIQIKKPPRPTTAQLQYIIQHEPDSLQAKLTTSPYAAILASPIRYCKFHRKQYPARLLQRFQVGLHPETHTAWAFPSDDGDGHGYYVKLHQGALDQVQKREHKRLLRGTAKYPDNMNQFLAQRMIKSLVNQVPSIEYTPIQQQQQQIGSYQCILQLQAPQPPSVTTSSDDDDTMVYPLYTDPWRPIYEALMAHYLPSMIPEKLGVVKSMTSVPFAVDLFRYHLWLQSSSTS